MDVVGLLKKLLSKLYLKLLIRRNFWCQFYACKETMLVCDPFGSFPKTFDLRYRKNNSRLSELFWAKNSTSAHVFIRHNCGKMRIKEMRTWSGYLIGTPGRGLPYGTDGNARRKFWNFPLKETIWAWLKLFVTPKWDQSERGVSKFWPPKRDR